MPIQDWTTLPFDHSGKWGKDVRSLMNPDAYVTWPQYIAEHIVRNRSQFIDKYKNLPKGKGWSNAISADFRKLIQQVYVICSYFPHPTDDDCVKPAFLAYLVKHKPLKIGAYRKNRLVNGKNNRTRLSITQAEKDCVLAIDTEYQKLLNRKQMQQQIIEEQKPVAPGNIVFRTGSSKQKTAIGIALSQEKSSG